MRSRQHWSVAVLAKIRGKLRRSKATRLRRAKRATELALQSASALRRMTIARDKTEGLSPALREDVPHDEPLLSGRCDVSKASLLKSRGRPHVGIQTRSGFDGIALNDICALRAGIISCSFEKSKGQLSTSEVTIDEKTHYWPNWHFVDSWKRLVTLKTFVGLTRCDLTPAHWLLPSICKNADWYTVLNQLLQLGGSGFFGGFLILGALHPPAHTRAITELAVARRKQRDIGQGVAGNTWYLISGACMHIRLRGHFLQYDEISSCRWRPT